MVVHLELTDRKGRPDPSDQPVILELKALPECRVLLARTDHLVMRVIRVHLVNPEALDSLVLLGQLECKDRPDLPVQLVRLVRLERRDQTVRRDQQG